MVADVGVAVESDAIFASARVDEFFHSAFGARVKHGPLPASPGGAKDDVKRASWIDWTRGFSFAGADWSAVFEGLFGKK